MAPGTAGEGESNERDLLHPDRTSVVNSGDKSARTYHSLMSHSHNSARQTLDCTP